MPLSNCCSESSSGCSPLSSDSTIVCSSPNASSKDVESGITCFPASNFVWLDAAPEDVAAFFRERFFLVPAGFLLSLILKVLIFTLTGSIYEANTQIRWKHANSYRQVYLQFIKSSASGRRSMPWTVSPFRGFLG